MSDTARDDDFTVTSGRLTLSDGLGKGFTGAFTWKNIGLQIGNGLISGTAGFAVGQLLGKLFDEGLDLRDMMQEFADQVVGRLSKEFREAITEAFFQDNLRKVKSATAALGEKYSAYETTEDLPLLDAALDQSFNVVADARSMGPPALGIFAVAAGLKMCLLEEKAKTNSRFHTVTLTEVQRASAYVETTAAEILAANERAVGQFRNCRTIPGEGRYCLITVDGRVINWPVTDPVRDRRRLVNTLNGPAMLEIIGPAREVAATWKRFR
jgi:hypothetical protein